MDVPPLVWRSNEELRRQIEIISIGNFMRGPVARGVCGALRHFGGKPRVPFQMHSKVMYHERYMLLSPTKGERGRPASLFFLGLFY